MALPTRSSQSTAARRVKRSSLLQILRVLLPIFTFLFSLASLVLLIVIVAGAVALKNSPAVSTIMSLATHDGIVNYLEGILQDPQVQEALSNALDGFLFGKSERNRITMKDEEGGGIPEPHPCGEREKGEICQIITDSCAQMQECAETHDHRKCRDALRDSVTICKDLVPGTDP